MIIRVVTGVVIGIAYGCVVGLVVFLLSRPDLQEHNSGVLMLDPVAIGWFVVEAAAVIAGASAVLVGLIVGIARLGKGKAAITGFLAGLLPLGVPLIVFGPPGIPRSAPEWIGVLVTIAILPIGVAVMGMVQAIAVQRL